MDWIRKPISQIIIILFALASWLLCLAADWVCSLPLFWQVLIGTIVGLALMGSCSITQTQRARSRRLSSIEQAQLSIADAVALRKLLPDPEKALSVLDHTGAGARWINVLLNKIWPHFQEASFECIKLHLQDALNNYRSQIIQQIQITELDLGNRYPYIEEIKVLPEEGTKLSLEIQFDWRQNENQQMVLNVLTSGPEYTVQVKHFVIYGIMKLTFTHFTEELPCFGAVIVSIIGQPLIDFQSRFLSGDLHQMPEIEKAVDSTLLATLMDLLVWPSRVVLPVIPGDYSALEATSVGFLYVQLLEARELRNKDIAGSTDPYVVLFVQRADHFTKKSKPMHDTSDPVWNEEFLFKIQDARVQKLTIKVMNWDDNDLDVCVGTAEFPISQLEESIPKEAWIDLVGNPEKLHEKYAGKIHLRFEFRPQDAFVEEPAVSSFTIDSATFSFPESSENPKPDKHNTASLDGLKVALGTSEDIPYLKIVSTPKVNTVMITELNILSVHDGNTETIDTNRADSKEVNVLVDAQNGILPRTGFPEMVDTNDIVDSIVSIIAMDGLKSAVEGIESISDTGSIVIPSDQSLSQAKFELFACEDDNSRRDDDAAGSVCAMPIDRVLTARETGLDASIISGKPTGNENIEICYQENKESIRMAMGDVRNVGSDLSVLDAKTFENPCTLNCDRELDHNSLGSDLSVLDAKTFENSCTSKCDSKLDKEMLCTEAATGSANSRSTFSEESSKDNSATELEKRDFDAHFFERLEKDYYISNGNPAQQLEEDYYISNGSPAQQKRVCWNIDEMFDSELFEVD